MTAMSGPLIRDIPSIKKNLELVRGFKALNTIMPYLKPLFRIFRIDVKEMEAVLAESNQLAQLAEELATIPDRFNDLFSARGWIIYDVMNLEVAKEAISKAELNDLDQAEAYLVDYYSPENVEWKLTMMNGVSAFRPRMPLAEKSLLDYREERYQACVPVVLALMDGMVNDLHDRQIGFFAQNANLEAWDSIAAHSKGLEVLANLFRSSRNKTTIVPISIPYRNGILHGRDLSYDNRLVAAKVWAALFATRDWAVRAEQGLLTAQPEKPEKSWGELFKGILENANDRKILDAWSPREIQLGVDVPITGEPIDYTIATPEYALVEFLCFWKVRNYGRMAALAWLNDSPGKDAGRVRNHYSSSNLKSFEIKELVDFAAAVTEIKVCLWLEGDISSEREVVFRMLNLDSKSSPVVQVKPDSKWCVANWGHGIE